MNTNFENLVSQVKSMIWAGYQRGNLIMERIPQLKQNPRRKNIAWACLMSVVVVVFFNMFGGQHLSEEAQVGYDFLEAYLSGDFVEAARYTERPDTINSDVAVMIKLNNGGYANEDRVKIRKETVEALEKLRATIKGIGLWKSDVSFINRSALIRLAIGVVGLAIGLTFVASLIGLIEGILYLTKSDEEFKQIYVLDGKEWF